MTHKIKIGIVMVVVIAVALAISFSSSKKQDGMSITYVGVSPSDSNQVVFTITNTSRSTLAWYIHFEMLGSRSSPVSIETLRHEDLKSLSASSFEITVPFDKRWRAAVWYDRPLESFVSDSRAKLARLAIDRTWYRFGNWIQPDPIMLWAYGPEMLGNKPAPSASK